MCLARFSHFHIESQHRHHRFDLSHQFPQGHIGLDPLDPRDVQTLESRGQDVLIPALQVPKAGEV